MKIQINTASGPQTIDADDDIEQDDLHDLVDSAVDRFGGPPPQPSQGGRSPAPAAPPQGRKSFPPIGVNQRQAPPIIASLLNSSRPQPPGLPPQNAKAGKVPVGGTRGQAPVVPPPVRHSPPMTSQVFEETYGSDELLKALHYHPDGTTFIAHNGVELPIGSAIRAYQRAYGTTPQMGPPLTQDERDMQSYTDNGRLPPPDAPRLGNGKHIRTLLFDVQRSVGHALTTGLSLQQVIAGVRASDQYSSLTPEERRTIEQQLGQKELKYVGMVVGGVPGAISQAASASSPEDVLKSLVASGFSYGTGKVLDGPIEKLANRLSGGIKDSAEAVLKRGSRMVSQPLIRAGLRRAANNSPEAVAKIGKRVADKVADQVYDKSAERLTEKEKKKGEKKSGE